MDRPDAELGQRPRAVRPGKVFMLLLPLLLLAIMGLSVAPVAGIHEGWAYYSHGDIAYQTPDVVPGPITLRIWVGWLRSHDSFRDLFHQADPAVPQYLDNKDVKKAGQVVPAVCVAWLLLSALVAFLWLLVWAFSLLTARRSPKSTKSGAPRTPFVTSMLWPALAFVLGIGCIGLAIASYIILAIGVAIYTRANLGGRTFLAWPDWCFFLALGAGVFWLLLLPVALGAAAAARKARRTVLTGAGGAKGPAGDPDERKALPFNHSAPVLSADGSGHSPHGNAWKAPTQGMSDENHGANGHVDNVHGYVVEHNRAHGSLSEDVTDTYHRTHPGSL